MSDAALESARALLDAARTVVSHDPGALSEIDALTERLDQPLRVALVGSVKAGKSTLLNGLLGERVAPTDARECTKIVTWYHHGTTPKVSARRGNGTRVSLPTRRQDGRLELDLQELTPETFDRIDVTWPAPGIRGITLIDTPGIVSISQDVSQQTNQFLLPDEGAAGADAVVYLLRSLHESDVRYMRALHERTRYRDAAMGAIAVLSRADELGSGQLTAMLSINEAVEHLRDHPDLKGICETIVPVAGLMGMGAMTLRQADFAVLADLAARDPESTRHLLISAERFVAAKDQWAPPERTRIDLVDRFGMYGVRLAIAALRGGVNDANGLSEELLRRSGLDELRRVIDVHFRQRQTELKAHSIVLALHRLLRQHAETGAEALLVEAEAHMAQAHTFTEMQLVGRIAGRTLALAPDRLAELDRLVGGRGSEPRVRLGLEASADTHTQIAAAVQQLSYWRTLQDNPLLDRDTFHACRVAERTCELMIADLDRQVTESAPHPRAGL